MKTKIITNQIMEVNLSDDEIRKVNIERLEELLREYKAGKITNVGGFFVQLDGGMNTFYTSTLTAGYAFIGIHLLQERIKNDLLERANSDE